MILSTLLCRAHSLCFLFFFLVAAISAAVQVIKWEELKLGELLGSGGFADVYKAEWRGDYVAVKVIKNQRDDDTFRLQFQQESLFLR